MGRANPKVGLDCSGLTMIVYARLGIHLAHFTGLQWQEGTHVGRNVRPGDLVFFEPTVLGPGTSASTWAAAGSSRRRTRATS